MSDTAIAVVLVVLFVCAGGAAFSLHRNPAAWERVLSPRTWRRVVLRTSTVVLAAGVGAWLGAGARLGVSVLILGAVVVFVEFLLWSQAQTFAPPDD